MANDVRQRTLIVACGALAREIRAVLAQSGPLSALVDVEYLPAPLHNRPQLIPAAVEAVLSARADSYARTVVAYADCGTGGLLEPVLARYGATRLPGSHCYEFFAGAAVFAALAEEEPGTFYLTDFLVRQFDQLVMVGLGLDRHPELRDQYFGNYRRVVLLSQSCDEVLVDLGRSAAAKLSLQFEHRHVGLEPFAGALTAMIGEVAP